MSIENDIAIGKSLGKIVEGSKELAYFSPNCCFHKQDKKENLLPIVNGVNESTCKCCGTKYKITVAGSLVDYSRIVREVIEDHRLPVVEMQEECEVQEEHEMEDEPNGNC